MSFEVRVRVIRAATRQVVVANTDVQLYPGDTVQTQADGPRASAWPTASTVVVRPNSPQSLFFFGTTPVLKMASVPNVHVVVDSGQMTVRTQPQSEDNRNVIETPKTRTRSRQTRPASESIRKERKRFASTAARGKR